MSVELSGGTRPQSLLMIPSFAIIAAKRRYCGSTFALAALHANAMSFVLRRLKDPPQWHTSRKSSKR
jgi:hypothetical protein